MVWPVIPVWMLETGEEDQKMLEGKAHREGTDLKCEFYEYTGRKYRDSVQVYTDGSKDPETGHTGAAVIVPEFRVSWAEGPLSMII